jgi:hypothetical protein
LSGKPGNLKEGGVISAEVKTIRLPKALLANSGI